ncbi:MAG: 16S rRNA (guanine(527)-N(7))-methyltransferase RsmG [Micrococcales bacterium]
MDQDYELEQEPAAAEAIFGANIGKARDYATNLVLDADILGLLGPREMPKLWSRHILNSAVVSELLVSGDTVADIGSGAGLPGIPMAIARPDVSFTLIEPMERRASWLQQQVDEIGLENVSVIRARAEEVKDQKFSVVTARAVSALPKLLRLCVPLVAKGGRVLALKGSKAQDEINDSQPLMKKLKIANFEIVHTGVTQLPESTLVVIARLN